MRTLSVTGASVRLEAHTAAAGARADQGFETVRTPIVTHPQEERFGAANPAIRKGAAWIEDTTGARA